MQPPAEPMIEALNLHRSFGQKSAVKGISLQKFMMLNRLWSVRTALLRAGPEDLIKTIALDHGFWHLGRFSRTYRTFFGESPSDTARRSAHG